MRLCRKGGEEMHISLLLCCNVFVYQTARRFEPRENDDKIKIKLNALIKKHKLQQTFVFLNNTRTS